VNANAVVNYVSAQPGTGKTKAAVEFMRRHVEAGHSGKRVGYIFYVAPTKELLLQTIGNLEKELQDKD
jgi:superfamily II DNA or RNA helicase